MVFEDDKFIVANLCERIFGECFMKNKKIIQRITDILMIIGLILLMAERQTGIVQHVIIGVVMFLIFIVHNVCNLSWWSYLGKGSCSPSRLRGTICNILLAIDLLVVMGSGFFNATGVHHISVLCFLILVVIHIIFRVKNNFEKGNGKQE